MSKIAATSGMGTLRWINAYVKQFPIVTHDHTFLVSKVIEKVTEIIGNKSHGKQTDALEEEINELVMDIYQLTEDEKEIVRKS